MLAPENSGNSPAVYKEYASVLTTMLLCNHFNGGSDLALRKCVYLLHSRVQTVEMGKVLVMLLRQTSILDWLDNFIAELNDEPMEFIQWANSL